MFRISILAALIVFSSVQFLHAQDLSVSESERVSSSLLNYRVLGKNKTGVLVYKHTREDETIEVYDDDMGLIRRKTLDSGPKGRNSASVNVILMGSEVLHFYTYKERRIQYLEVQRMNDKLVNLGRPVKVDSFDKRENENWSDFFIRRSTDHSGILVYRAQRKLGDLSGIHATLLGPTLGLKWQEMIAVNEPDRSMILADAFLSEAGDVAFGLIRDEGRIRASVNPFVVTQIRAASGSAFIRTAVTPDEKFKLREAHFEWDNINGNATVVGFFSEESRAYVSGVFFLAVEPGKSEPRALQFEGFKDGFVKGLTGKSSGKREEIPVYSIQDVIVRSDGGVLVAAEYVNESAESYEYTDYDPYYGGYRTSTRYINYHEYEDIILFMISPDGVLEWDDVIRKKQISREDYGKNSSYCMLKANNRLFFIFNEDISYDTNVMQYMLDTAGKLDRNSIMNANAKEVMLVPRKAKQVSGNEVVIPSVYKNNLSFVKLSY